MDLLAHARDHGPVGATRRDELDLGGLVPDDEPALFDVMFGRQGNAGRLGAGRGPGGLTASELLTRALDDCVAAELVEPEARRGAELLLWPAVHGLAVLGRDGVLGVDPATAFRVQFAAVRRSMGVWDVAGSAEDAPGR